MRAANILFCRCSLDRTGNYREGKQARARDRTGRAGRRLERRSLGTGLTIRHTALELHPALACEIFEFVDISITQPDLTYVSSLHVAVPANV